MDRKIRKTVFPVAGFGTRFLPATNATAAPTNLTSVGRYVLTPGVFQTLQDLSAGYGGEIQLADAINIHAQQGFVETMRLNGRRFDCGSVDGLMRASYYEYGRRKVTDG